MNQEVKEKWLAALQSGKYKHGKGCLKRVIKEGTFHCCLGVLCEVAKENGVEIPETTRETYTSDEVGFKSLTEGFTEYYLLPVEVMKWAELPFNNPFSEGQPLSGVNDDDSTNSYEPVIELIKKL